MAVCVSDILKNENLTDAKVVAGKKGLKATVTSVTVGEVPDIARWLEGGEMILSTLYAVGEKTEDQLKFIEQLINAKASALLVKPERFIGKLDPKIIKLAEDNGFPLIEVPPQIRWTDIVGKIYHQIIGQHLDFQKRSFDIHRKLLDQVIKGEGYESIANTAAALIDRPVVIEDESGEVLAKAKLKKEHADLLPKFEIKKSEDLGHAFRTRLEKNKRFPAKISTPIIVEQETLGHVSTIEATKALNELDLIALQHAATITALEMGKERIKLEAEIRLKGDFIDDLIAKQFQSKEALLKRASYLGCDLSKGSQIMIVDIDDFEEHINKNKYKENDIQRIRREFFNTVNWIIGLEAENSLVSLKSDSVIIFLTPNGVDKEGLESKSIDVAKSLQKGLAERFEKFSFSVGLSTYHDSSEVDKAFNEARIALDISKRLDETKKISSFKDVGTYKLLTRLMDNNAAELEDFFEETVAPLIEYDKEHDSELVHTLEAFFRYDENINEVAKNMFAHRHTIRYRLERIKELAGLDIHKSNDKERLALGLKLSRLLP
ncbi:hypothetical protein LCGC14_1346940 [marine sediment metagenome]|uniref:GGDEF domain-containing protein n=1 Tax=marine sediment metagenome TaxID=412755 RepID=A0A0F9KCL9_9ZZZZ